MLELEPYFLQAWQTARPLLDSSPDERNARLQRRTKTARLQRPPREWCIALRANDRRISPLRFAIVPDKAPCHHDPHDVTIDRAALFDLHHPVATDAPANLIPEVAQRLGVTDAAVRKEIRAGSFTQRRVKGLGGKRDRWGGIPLVFSPQQFDPNYGNRRRGPDPVWGTQWQDLPHNVDPTFAQTLRRVPRLVDDKRRREPRRRRHPGELTRFWGWQWQCPGCSALTRLLFLPTPVPVFDFCQEYLDRHAPDDGDLDRDPKSSFACAKCHKVHDGVSWASKDAWNHIVTVCSAGLLYGHEVEIPAWLNRQTRHAGPHRKHTRVRPRQAEVESRLARGMTNAEIATDIAMHPATVGHHVTHIKQKHATKTRRQLVEKLQRLAAPRAKTA